MKASCPECGRPTEIHLDSLGRVNGASLMPKRCSSCLAESARRVEVHAVVWAPLLMVGLAISGRLPEIDPALRRSS